MKLASSSRITCIDSYIYSSIKTQPVAAARSNYRAFLVLKVEPRAMAVVCSDDELRVSLTDGRWLSVPIAWFPRLAHASPVERANYVLLGEGQGIHWPGVDEDVSVLGLIAGQPSV